MKLQREWLDYLRAQPPGSFRIRARDVGQSKPEPGATATLQSIDDNGLLHVIWEDGSDSHTVIEQNLAAIIPPESVSLKLYMPLTADFCGADGVPVKLNGRDLVTYIEPINSDLIRYSGLPDDEPALGDLASKVKFVGYSAEKYRGELWGVAQLMVIGELSNEELTAVKQYVEDDAAEALGTAVEDHELDVIDGSLCVHLWNETAWSIQTKDELLEGGHTMKTQKEWLEFLREQYPNGSRIKLREMGRDDPAPVPPGTMGTLYAIDDLGTFHIKWDNGRSLGLVPGQDSFTVSPPPLQTLKLYMPMTATYCDEDDPEQEITMDSREAAEYAPQIINALQSERRWLENESPEAAERGLMAYFDGPDSIDQKVHSCFFNAEVRDGQLWGTAECRVRGSLTPLELQRLIDEIGGQASDGVGESFEQREIKVGGGLEIYAHLWQSEGWSIMPEQDRFDPHFSERLPDMCFTVLPEDGSLAYIIKGVGCQRFEESTEQPGANRYVADYRNMERGISKTQEQAMVGGCLHGWDSPAADPKTYEQTDTQPRMGGMDLA